MKPRSMIRKFALLLGSCLALCGSASAQTTFTATLSNNVPYLVPVNTQFTYNMTFAPALSTILTVLVTNTLPANVQLVSSNTTQGTISVTGKTVVFNLGQVVGGLPAQMNLVVNPTASGVMQDTASFYSPSFTNANNFFTLSVSNQVIALADLGVTLTAPSQIIYPGDSATLHVFVTNAGPATATAVVLTNTVPAGVKLISVSPSGLGSTATNGLLIFNLGTLTNGGSTNLALTIQTTNAGTFPFSAFVGSAGIIETSLANNSATVVIPVASYFPATLLVVTNSSQITNRQNGLIEQKILVSNVGTSAVDSVRLIVTGLTNVAAAGFTNYLFNATGTNNGNPFVTYAAALTNGDSVELLLQFYSRTRSHFPFTNSQLNAFAVSPPDLTPPTGATTSTNINFTRIFPLSTGEMFLEFKSTLGRIYTIVYSDNASFSNAVMAVPPVVATANYVQWIDYGPPATVSKPPSGPRFYKVFLNP